MAYQCDICSKKRLVGNKVSHSNIKSKTTQRPNLHRVATMINGTKKRVLVCTRCLRSGKVVKAA